MELQQTMRMEPETKKTYRLGLALSGGGSKGFAHLGAIQALDEWGIRPDVISGTSAGAVVAAFYASGYTPMETLNLFLKHEARDFLGFTFPKESFLRYDGFVAFLQEHFHAERIEDLKIPLHTDCISPLAGRWSSLCGWRSVQELSGFSYPAIVRTGNWD